ncbi:MAG: TolC family protein [Tepidisphaeraceae bacterium]
MRLRLPVILAVACLAGCAPSFYREWADRDVQRLVNSREKKTLDYTPEAQAAVTIDPTPEKKAYSKIPLSPQAPASSPQIEPAKIDLPYGPLGPDMLFDPEVGSAQFEMYAIDAVREPTLQRLRLGPPSVHGPRHTFGLFEALRYAVLHSRDYQTQMENLYLAALTVTLQRHLFEPRPFANASAQYNAAQLDSGYSAALTATGAVGVRQQLPYGGEIVAQTLVNFVNALVDNSVDGESASIAISGSIPLLRGAGMVNLEPLILSERQLVYQVRQFEDFRRDFVVQVATQYFRIIAAQEAIANRRFNYVSLAGLTERTLALFDAGRLNFLQVQRAEQSQLSSENQLIDAEELYQDLLDQFKLLIGMPIEDDLEVTSVELDVSAPDVARADPTGLAVKYRLDLQTALDQVDDARRNVQVRQNSLLPDLTLTGQGQVGNIEGSPAIQIDGRALTYGAGVNLELPLDRVGERNAYRASLILLEQSQRNYVQTRDQIITDVRAAMRAIQAAQVTLELQRMGTDLAQRRVDFATELLIQGRSTDSRDVTEAQSSLLSAQDAYARARAELQVQILQFLRDTGTLRLDPNAGILGHVLDRLADAQTPSMPQTTAKLAPGG